MPQPECVSQFVNGLLQETLPQQVLARRHPVGFLSQTGQRYRGTVAVQLRFAEHKRQDRDKQIAGCHA
jgi:hypothetical protein